MPALLADWVVRLALWKAAAAANVVAATAKVTVLMVLLLGVLGKKDRIKVNPAILFMPQEIVAA